jgi:hypothetical protein
MDDEVKGDGNSVNYSFRMHDPRLGRFFAIDPLNADYPWNCPYAFSENIVINAVELEGLEKVVVYVWDAKSKTWKHDINDDYIDNALEVNVNLYLIPYASGGVKKSVMKSWDKKKSYTSYGSMDYQLMLVQMNGGGYNASPVRGKDPTYYDPLEGNDEPQGYHIPSEKEKRIAGNSIIIIGGIATMIATGGTSSAYVLSAGILSGSMATAGGMAKMTLDLNEQFEKSDKVPTGFLNATIGATIEYTYGDSKTTHIWKGSFTVIEGIATFSIPTNTAEGVADILTITNVILDSDVSKASKALKKR